MVQAVERYVKRLVRAMGGSVEAVRSGVGSLPPGLLVSVFAAVIGAVAAVVAVWVVRGYRLESREPVGVESRQGQ